MADTLITVQTLVNGAGRYIDSAEKCFHGDVVNIIICTSTGAALGAMAAWRSNNEKPTPGCMGLVAITFAAVVPFTTVIGPRDIWRIMANGIFKATSSFLYAVLTDSRDGMIVTLAHAEHPLTCSYTNAYHTASYAHTNPLMGTAGYGQIVQLKTESCLLLAADRKRLQANHVDESEWTKFWQVTSVWHQVLTTAMSGINDRALLATCIGFFAGIVFIKFTTHSAPIGVNRFYKNLEVVQKLPFYGKKWMLSVMTCRAICFIMITYFSHKSLDERTTMFLAGGSSKKAQWALIILSDQLFWFGVVSFFQFMDLVPDLKTVCGWFSRLFPEFVVEKLKKVSVKAVKKIKEVAGDVSSRTRSNDQKKRR
jgi:hypothetical protein